MTELEYQEYIRHTHNAFCKIVIRHAAIDKILKLRRRWEREVSLDYLMNEKFVQLAEPAARPPFCTMRNLPLPLPSCRSRHRKKFFAIIFCASRNE